MKRKKLLLGILMLISILLFCSCKLIPASTASADSMVHGSGASSSTLANNQEEKPYSELLCQVLDTVDLESRPDLQTQALYVELLYQVLDSIDPQNTTLNLGARVFPEPTFGYFEEGKFDVSPLIYENVNGWNTEQASRIIDILKSADYRFSKYGRFASDVLDDIAYIESDDWTLEGVRFENIVYLTIEDVCFMYVIFPTESGVVAIYDELSDWYELASGTPLLDIYGPPPTMEPQDPDKAQTDLSEEECTELLYQALESLASDCDPIMIGGSVYPTSPKRFGGPNKVGLVPVSYEEVDGRSTEQANHYIQILNNSAYVFYTTVGWTDEVLDDQVYLKTDTWTLTAFPSDYLKLTIDGATYYYHPVPYSGDATPAEKTFSDWNNSIPPELYDVLCDWYEDVSGTALINLYE